MNFLNLLPTNAVADIIGSWVGFGAYRLGATKFYLFIDGSAGGGTVTLRWRQAGSSGNGMVICRYTNVTTDLMVPIQIPPGELQVQVSGATGPNCMPEIVY